MTTLSPLLAAKRDRLLRLIGDYGSCAVAYSGGVDSAVVAKAAHLALGEAAVAITGNSDALAEGELTHAREVADLIGIRHVVIPTHELSNPNYVANAPDRCFHCKTELYTRLRAAAERIGICVLANGAIIDDLGDFRPGMKATGEQAVLSPLIQCGLSKSEVRQLANEWQLPVADKPATPCLSSRIAYGQRVTTERLRMIDKAEQFLRSLGFRQLRVRYHGDDLARIEVPLSELGELSQPLVRAAIIEQFSHLGFKFVTLDLAGFRSGSFSALIPPEELRRFS